MKYFIVEGILKDSDKINEDIMKKHMAYTQKAMDEGIILVSGLKSESVEKLESYLSNEPFKLYGIQDYKFVEFNAHYFNPSPSEWFK